MLVAATKMVSVSVESIVESLRNQAEEWSSFARDTTRKIENRRVWAGIADAYDRAADAILEAEEAAQSGYNLPE